MAKKAEPDGHLWSVVFEYYPNFEFTQEAQDIFEEKVTKFWWVVLQDGSIESRRSRRKRVTLIMDLDDKTTLDSMNLLPKFIKDGFSPRDRDSWRVRVYDRDDPAWIDFVRIDAEGGIFLELLNKAWDDFNEEQAELLMEVKKISATLQ